MKNLGIMLTSMATLLALSGCASSPSEEETASSSSSASSAEMTPKAETSAHPARFLPDYSRLKKDPDDEKRLIWVNSDMTQDSYTGVIVAPVVFHLDPKLAKDGVRPDEEAMNQIFDYFHEALVREFGRYFAVTDTPGTGVMRYQPAITGLDTKTDMGDSPVDFLPVIFVARAASGADKVEALIFMEAFAKDSLSGELLAEVVQSGQGGEVGEGKEITLGTVRPVLDAWAKKAASAAKKATDQAGM